MKRTAQSTRLTDGPQTGQASVSVRIAQTRSAGAGISIVVVKGI